MLVGGRYVPYGWSGGGGSTSDMLIGSLSGALYSLETGLLAHFMQGSSEMVPPRWSVTVAYGSGGGTQLFGLRL